MAACVCVYHPLGRGNTSPIENHILEAFETLTGALGTLETRLWFSKILFQIHVYDVITPEVPCKEQLNLCSLYCVRRSWNTSSCARAAEPCVCLVLSGKSFLLSGPFISPLSAFYRAEDNLPKGSFWLHRLDLLAILFRIHCWARFLQGQPYRMPSNVLSTDVYSIDQY
jgi:hypothetical protein